MPVVPIDSAPSPRRAGLDTMTGPSDIQDAEQALRDVTESALKKTAILLTMIGEGDVSPEIALIAARDLQLLLDAVQLLAEVRERLQTVTVRTSKRVH